ncbi:MAG: 30S ribosomal protein S4 [Candidatus Firestonebacteria bacterium]
MARITGAKCRLCRREKIKLFLKGDRCYTGKCAIEKGAIIPGQHGKKMSKLSEYGIRLREKQRAKRIYGMNEGQFRRFYGIAAGKKGVTGEYLLKLLESRLDSVVYRAGLAASRDGAKILVLHGHVQVNGKMVNIASYILKPGEVVSIREKSKQMKAIKMSVDRIKERGGITSGAWLDVDFDNLKVTFKKMPEEAEIGSILNKQLIVEFYNR